MGASTGWSIRERLHDFPAQNLLGESPMLISDKIALAFNEQIGHEFGNANQYLAIANYFEFGGPLRPGEDLLHAGRRGARARHEVRQVPARRRGRAGHPGHPRARNAFESAVDAAQLALDSELTTTRQIYDLVTLATEEKNYIALELPPVVRQRTARGSLERRDPPVGDPPGRARACSWSRPICARQEVSGYGRRTSSSSFKVRAGSRVSYLG